MVYKESKSANLTLLRTWKSNSTSDTQQEGKMRICPTLHENIQAWRSRLHNQDSNSRTLSSHYQPIVNGQHHAQTGPPMDQSVSNSLPSHRFRVHPQDPFPSMPGLPSASLNSTHYSSSTHWPRPTSYPTASIMLLFVTILLIHHSTVFTAAQNITVCYLFGGSF